MTRAPIRVLVAIRDPITSIGLTTVLDREPDIRCHAPRDLTDLRGAVGQDPPDVLLLDVAIRRADPQLIGDLLAAYPSLKVLVYVDHSPEECALQHLIELGGRARLSAAALGRLDDCCLTSLRQRAHGCLGTGSHPEAVARSVRATMAGGVVAAPWVGALTRALRDPAGSDGGPPPISLRELEIMSLLAEGLSNRQIAERLGIREQTVKNHVTRTMEKLGVANRTEVGLLAARHHLRLVGGESGAEVPEAD